jgi:hypothetical protein
MIATRKRSSAITLVLAGALSGCSDPQPQRDVYTRLEDCTKDWGTPTKCAPVNDGRHSSSYFYGPSYFGSSYPSGRLRPSPNAIEASPASRGGITHMAGGNQRSGISSASGSVSRSGFGSSAHSMSSGG